MMTFLRTFGRRLKRCWRKITEWFKNCADRVLFYLLGKVVNDLAVVYATLIVKGKKTFSQVPATLKEQVRQILIDLDLPELAEE